MARGTETRDVAERVEALRREAGDFVARLQSSPLLSREEIALIVSAITAARSSYFSLIREEAPTDTQIDDCAADLRIFNDAYVRAGFSV